MDVLERIFAQKRIDLVRCMLEWPINEVKALVHDIPSTRGFLRAVETSPHPIALIAEVKKASPVSGILREEFHPVEIARAFSTAGADCLSVLTDIEFFHGHPDYVNKCRNAATLPVLRKDFIVDEYDVWVSRAIGADAILLISEYLETRQLRDYRLLAESVGMDALVEVHSPASAERALASGALLVGINNRNLRTFEVDLAATEEIATILKGHVTIVSESAITAHEDVVKVAASGARAVLVGSVFSKSQDIGEKVKEVMGW